MPEPVPEIVDDRETGPDPAVSARGTENAGIASSIPSRDIRLLANWALPRRRAPPAAIQVDKSYLPRDLDEARLGQKIGRERALQLFYRNDLGAVDFNHASDAVSIILRRSGSRLASIWQYCVPAKGLDARHQAHRQPETILKGTE